MNQQLAQKSDDIFVTNPELVNLLKKHLNLTGNYSLVVQFGFTAVTAQGPDGVAYPTSISQVTKVGVAPVPVPVPEQLQRATPHVPHTGKGIIQL
jgi:hypothetical protein